MRIYGDTKRLTPKQRKELERLYRRRVPPAILVTPELGREISEISRRLNRQVAVLIDRKGRVSHVILGDHDSILIPDLTAYRIGWGSLRGLRCVHTHLSGEPISEEDLTDMVLLRLDAMVVVQSTSSGLPGEVTFAHIVPQEGRRLPWQITVYPHLTQIEEGFDHLLREIEDELRRAQRLFEARKGQERALLVVPLEGDEADDEEYLVAELTSLAESAGVEVADVITQRIRRINPATYLGRGKVRELLMRSLEKGCTMVIFGKELTPVQANAIASLSDLKVLDRTQLILDIFAQRAQSLEGRIQVELAQLRYMLPRLVGRGTAMSKLMGGVGGRGPGETKLEVDRRRVRDRIAHLERRLKAQSKGRKLRRKGRGRRGTPVVSLVGYTNAGKTTLINRLTRSDLKAEDRLFATLDTTSRQRVLPGGTKCIFTDTVGFIRHMPKDLKVAFKATLEELEDAALLLHVVDATSERWDQEMEVVDAILEELGLSHLERIMVFNKVDLLSPEGVELLPSQGVMVSALTGYGIDRLLAEIEARLSVTVVEEGSLEVEAAGY